ncbi:MAG: EcsC family protein [Lentimicrobium sp.]|nr:EcsC family protein [Lentimicrobium sp.]
MNNKPTTGTLLKVLDWAYDKALAGLPGLNSAVELSESYLKQEGSLRHKANALIRWQNVKSGSSGFITGLGGFMTLPVAIPANLASVLFIQIRMIAAIAHMGGYDLRDDRVKSLVFACLAGNIAKDILQEIGISAGTRITAQLIGRISEQTIIAINQKVGFQLFSKTGGKSLVNLGKAVPLVGGVIGGSFDTVMTNLIGNIARDVFIGKSIPAES